jgi:hypothetical protein
MLLRDLGGYRIGIHGDSVSKAITVQLYLPRDDAPTSDADGERNSIMLTYYVQIGAFDRLAVRAKRLWVFFAYAVRG